MMAQTGETAKTPTDPKKVTYNKFLEILQNNEAGVAVRALCEIACKENPQIDSYLGKNWTMESNIKLKAVIDMLRNHSQVKEVKSKPLVLQCFGSVSDVSDISDTTKFRIENKNQGEKQKDAISYTSDVSDSTLIRVLKCPFQLQLQKHPSKRDRPSL